MIIITFAANAQKEVGDQSNWKERIYVGGGFGINSGLTQGYRYFYVALNPIVGYMVTPKFSVGSGVNWQHYRFTDLKTSIDQYGVSPFVRRNFNQIFLYGEYNLLNTPVLTPGGSSIRRSYDRLLMGVGYSQPLGQRGSINAMALYDVIYNSSEFAFASPWVFRVFFSF